MFCFFFFNDTATTEIYTLSLHDALPIFDEVCDAVVGVDVHDPVLLRQLEVADVVHRDATAALELRSEEHTSELQSPCNLVCRLLLEKKKQHALLHSFIITNDILLLYYTL